ALQKWKHLPNFIVAWMKPSRAYVEYMRAIYRPAGRFDGALPMTLRKLAESLHKKLFFLDPDFKAMQIGEKNVGIKELKELLEQDPDEIRRQRQILDDFFWSGDSDKLAALHALEENNEHRRRAQGELRELRLHWISKIQDFHL